MATITIDFTNYFPLDSDLRVTYNWLDWDTVNVGSGIYKANCRRVLERVSTDNSVTITYDSDTVLNKGLSKKEMIKNYPDSDEYTALDSEGFENITTKSNLYVIDFNNKAHNDSDVTIYYFKV